MASVWKRLRQQLDQGDVEGAAAEVVDEHRLRPVGERGVRAGDGVAALERVGQGRGGRLVEDVEHVQPGDAAGVLGRLAAGVVEVGRDGDDRLA